MSKNCGSLCQIDLVYTSPSFSFVTGLQKAALADRAWERYLSGVRSDVRTQVAGLQKAALADRAWKRLLARPLVVLQLIRQSESPIARVNLADVRTFVVGTLATSHFLCLSTVCSQLDGLLLQYRDTIALLDDELPLLEVAQEVCAIKCPEIQYKLENDQIKVEMKKKLLVNLISATMNLGVVNKIARPTKSPSTRLHRADIPTFVIPSRMSSGNFC